MPRKTDKRVRLIEAAMILIHQQSFNLTTLADIAHKAEVPLGNVYYYFKKKEDIGEAVIEKLAATYSELLKQLDEVSFNPTDRLKSFIKHTISNDNLDQVARYGCSVGGLCQELSKQGGPLADRAAKLLHDLLQWSEKQLSAIGCGSESADFALSFISSIQGAYLLTHTFKDPQFSIRQSEMLLDWVDKIKSKYQATTKASAEEAFA
jgi:TetR/AcrR family transcriptional regulator, transcriptional repressor for nem operon